MGSTDLGFVRSFEDYYKTDSVNGTTYSLTVNWGNEGPMWDVIFEGAGRIPVQNRRKSVGMEF